MRNLIASVCLAASLAAMAPGASAFALTSAPMLRGSQLAAVKSGGVTPVVARRSGAMGLRAQVGGFVPKVRTMDDFFLMLKDDRSVFPPCRASFPWRFSSPTSGKIRKPCNRKPR
jgi:hypothetical protein